MSKDWVCGTCGMPLNEGDNCSNCNPDQDEWDHMSEFCPWKDFDLDTMRAKCMAVNEECEVGNCAPYQFVKRI